MSSTNKKVVPFEDYPTPRELTSAFLKEVDWEAVRDFAKSLGRKPRFLEPCRGPKRNIYDLVPEDLERYYCEIQEGLDYLETDLSGLDFDVVVTNPPFSLFQEFVTKARAEAHPQGLVAFLMRVNALGSIKRLDFWNQNPPDKLITCIPRPDFSGKGGDSCEYCWFCWDPRDLLSQHNTLSHLRWEKPSKRRRKKEIDDAI